MTTAEQVAPTAEAWWVRGVYAVAAHRRGPYGQSLCGLDSATDPAAPWRPAPDDMRHCARCAVFGAGGGRGDLPAGATYRQLDHWVRLGYLHPLGGRGSGSVRAWPPGELAVADCMARLVAAGLRPEAAHRVARGGDLAPGITIAIADPADEPAAERRAS